MPDPAISLPVLSTERPLRLTPTDVTQFIHFEQCERFLRFRLAERELARVQLERAEQVMKMHAVVAPVAGTVMAVTKHPGEAVNELGGLV